MESCENLLLNSSSQRSGVWRAVEGKFLLLQTLCFLFSRKIDLPEEMGSLNILNIKYIIQEKPQTNPSIMILFLWIQVLMHWQMGLFLSHWSFPSVPGKVTLEVFTVLEPRLWCHRTNELSTNLSVECKLQVLARLGHPTVAVFPFVSGRKDPTGSLLLCVCKYQLSVTVLCLIFHCEIYFGARKAVLLKTVHN